LSRSMDKHMPEKKNHTLIRREGEFSMGNRGEEEVLGAGGGKKSRLYQMNFEKAGQAHVPGKNEGKEKVVSSAGLYYLQGKSALNFFVERRMGSKKMDNARHRKR